MRRGAALVALALVAALLTPTVAPAPPAQAARAPRLDAYRGLGSWIDIYDTRELGRPVATVRAMARRGVRTLYLETANYHSGRAIVHPRATERLIHAAHARGMKVVAWYLPGFRNLKRDRRRSMAAIRYRTSRGQRFDSFALDIEASIVRNPRKRTKRLMRLSRFLRRKTGASYPMGAIIPAPRGMELSSSYWPGFPYRRLARFYDVFVPMGYFTYRVKGREAARDYTRRNIEIIRAKTGRPRVPIHVIGGISDDASGPEVRGFVRAVREHGVLGASLYAFDNTRPRHWRWLAHVPTNPRQSPPLPVPVGHTGALGNVPGADRSHPKEVFFATGGLSGDRRIEFEAFDAQAGEVELWVNWRKLADVAPTPGGAWGAQQSVDVPAGRLRSGGRNYVHFVAAGNHPSWSVWGVRNVTLVPA